MSPEPIVDDLMVVAGSRVQRGAAGLPHTAPDSLVPYEVWVRLEMLWVLEAMLREGAVKSLVAHMQAKLATDLLDLADDTTQHQLVRAAAFSAALAAAAAYSAARAAVVPGGRLLRSSAALLVRAATDAPLPPSAAAADAAAGDAPAQPGAAADGGDQGSCYADPMVQLRALAAGVEAAYLSLLGSMYGDYAGATQPPPQDPRYGAQGLLAALPDGAAAALQQAAAAGLAPPLVAALERVVALAGQRGQLLAGGELAGGGSGAAAGDGGPTAGEAAGGSVGEGASEQRSDGEAAEQGATGAQAAASGQQARSGDGEEAGHEAESEEQAQADRRLVEAAAKDWAGSWRQYLRLSYAHPSAASLLLRTAALAGALLQLLRAAAGPAARLDVAASLGAWPAPATLAALQGQVAGGEGSEVAAEVAAQLGASEPEGGVKLLAGLDAHWALVARAFPRRCCYCAELAGEAVELKRCGACQRAWYCSVPCQKAAWKTGHKERCGVRGP